MKPNTECSKYEKNTSTTCWHYAGVLISCCVLVRGRLGLKPFRLGAVQAGGRLGKGPLWWRPFWSRDRFDLNSRKHASSLVLKLYAVFLISFVKPSLILKSVKHTAVSHSAWGLSLHGTWSICVMFTNICLVVDCVCVDYGLCLQCKSFWQQHIQLYVCLLTLYNEAGLGTLKTRRDRNGLLFFFKIIHSMFTGYLQELKPVKPKPGRYTFGNKNNLVEPNWK